MWIPAVVIDEVLDIKREDGIKTSADALRKMIKYTRVGREAKRIIAFDFSKSKPQLPIEAYKRRRR